MGPDIMPRIHQASGDSPTLKRSPMKYCTLAFQDGLLQMSPPHVRAALQHALEEMLRAVHLEDHLQIIVTDGHT